MLAAGGRPTNLDNGRARAYCVCSRCGWGLFGYFFSRLSFLFSFSLSLGWMDNLGFYVHFSRISLISRRWLGNGWLCAMETQLLLKRFPPQAGLESRDAKSAGQRLTN